MKRSARGSFLIYSALNIVGALVLVLLAIETWVRPRVAIADYGAPLGLALLFLLIPVGMIAARIVARVGAEPRRGVRRYLRLSQVFLTGMWFLSCVPVGLLVLLLEPWPVSLRQGPDTATAKAGFAEVFGVEPPAGVSGVYYRMEGGWGDSVIYLRFDVEAPAELASLAEAAGLLAYAPGAPRPSPPDGPAWWDSQSVDTASELYLELVGGNAWRALWFPQGSTTAHYFDFRP